MAKAFADIARRTIRTSDGKADSRRKMIVAVRAACRRLGLDDDARRETQQALVGKTSMSDMTLAELGVLLDRFNKDWKGPAGHGAHAGKVRALWWTLYWLGAVEEAKDAAIDAFVRRQTGVSALRFLDHRSAPAVIEALKSWASREGVAWAERPTELCDRIAVCAAIWRRLVDLGEISVTTMAAYVGPALAIPPDPKTWTRHEWDAAIKLLGKRLRRAPAKS